MSENEIAQGKTWIENTLLAIATEFGVKIDKTEWGRWDDDFTSGIESLSYVIDGKRHVEKFSEENLEDCPNHNTVKRCLEDRLAKMVKSACTSTPKIGFNRT